MAVITVTSATDDALRAAVALANASAEDDVIRFSSDLAGATITLSETLVFGGSSTTLIDGDVDGDGAGDITISGDFDGNGMIDASDSGTMVFAGSSGGVALQNLRLTGSYIRGVDGGAVNAAAVLLATGANVTLRDVRIDDATAIGGTGAGIRHGGDAATIMLTGGAHLFEDVIFEDVSASGGIGEAGFDGGRASAGVLLLGSGTDLAFNDIALRDALANGGNTVGGPGTAGSAVAGIYSTNGRADLFGVDGTAAIFVSGDQSAALAGVAEPGSGGTDGGALLGLADPGDILEGLAISPLVPSSGNDTIDATAAAVALRLLGFGGDDFLAGGSEGDLLRGGAGNDQLSGGLGDDTIRGGAGDDILLIEGATFVAGLAQEVLNGGTGNDTIGVAATAAGSVEVDGGDGVDLIDFSASPTGMRAILGIDLFFEAQTDDTPDLFDLRLRNIENVIGSGFDDAINGTDGDNVVDSGAGDDLVVTGGGDDVIGAGAGDDRVLGGFGNDLIFGGTGDDTIGDQFGTNLIDGGEGDDVVEFDNGRSTFDIAKRGNDLILTFGEGETTLRNVETLVFGGTDVVLAVDLLATAPEAPEQPTGPTPDDDVLTGTGGADFIDALAGDDSVRGLGGEDTLKGSAGEDTIKGGGGNDTVKGNGGADRVVGQAGDDRVVGGGGDDTVIGSNGNDLLFGRGGDDVLRGGSGDDRILGNRGDDSLRGNAGNDVFSFKRNDGDDVVRDFRDGQDMIEIRNGAGSFGQLAFEQMGNHVLMSFKGTTVLFQRTDLAEFDSGDFIF
ncbi:MAG: calcium-binding protein [Pseudomonadota bacterium]